MITITACLNHLTQQLQNVDVPAYEASLLLTLVLDKPHSFLYAHPEYQLTDMENQALKGLLTRRLSGEPMAYLLQQQGFWSLDFEVTPDTLIPRPDTEALVAFLVDTLPNQARVLELGTGSGAIAISVAYDRPNVSIIATDISQKALSVAQRNAQKHGVQNITFIASDWFCDVTGAFDAIVSNPPYIARTDKHLDALCYEPELALVSAADGLSDLTQIITQAPTYLRVGGLITLEHGADQGAVVRDLLSKYGYENVQTKLDLEKRDRFTHATRGATIPA